MMKRLLLLCLFLVGCQTTTTPNLPEKSFEIIETVTGTTEITLNGKPEKFPKEIVEINKSMIVLSSKIEKNFASEIGLVTLDYVSKKPLIETVDWIRSYEAKRKSTSLLDQLDSELGEYTLIFDNTEFVISYHVVPHSTIEGYGEYPTVIMIYKIK